MSYTIKDVAKKAGVSVSTVSNVINNKRVSKNLKAKVLRAIQELKYKPNKFARGLPRRRNRESSFTTVIGLSFPYYFTEGVKALTASVKYRAAEIGLQVIEYLNENDSQKQMQQISEMLERRVDGVICFPVDYKKIEKSVEDCHLANIPFVALNRIAYGHVYATVKSDDYKAGNDLGLYVAFKLKGKRGKILEIQTEMSDFNSIQRSAGFNDVIKNWPGVDIVCRYHSGVTAVRAKECTIQALKEYPDINVIFCHSDEIAKGALDALKQLGKDYPIDDPRHVILLGIDGDRFALNNIRKGMLDATSEQLLWEQGVRAVDLTVDALNGKTNYNPLVLIPTKLITKENVNFIKDHWAQRNIDLHFSPLRRSNFL